MELVANVWPVVDAATGMIQRFYLRAYAMGGSDETISRTLRALAPGDFRMARLFAVPKRFRLVTEFGSMAGAIHISDFNARAEDVIAEALQRTERDAEGAIGIDVSGEGAGKAVPHLARFPEGPYLVITHLLESADGILTPKVPQHDSAGESY